MRKKTIESLLSIPERRINSENIFFGHRPDRICGASARDSVISHFIRSSEELLLVDAVLGECRDFADLTDLAELRKEFPGSRLVAVRAFRGSDRTSEFREPLISTVKRKAYSQAEEVMLNLCRQTVLNNVIHDRADLVRLKKTKAVQDARLSELRKAFESAKKQYEVYSDTLNNECNDSIRGKK